MLLRIILPVFALAIYVGACTVDPPVNRNARSGEVATRSDTSSTRRAAPGRTAFTNVNVIPMNEEGVLENHTVLIEDGRIVRVGPSNRIESYTR